MVMIENAARPHPATNQLIMMFKGKIGSDVDVRAGRVFLRSVGSGKNTTIQVEVRKWSKPIVWLREAFGKKSEYDFSRNIDQLKAQFEASFTEIAEGKVSRDEIESIGLYLRYYQKLITTYADRHAKKEEKDWRNQFKLNHSLLQTKYDTLNEGAKSDDETVEIVSKYVLQQIDACWKRKDDVPDSDTMKLLIQADSPESDTSKSLKKDAQRFVRERDELKKLYAEIPAPMVRDYNELFGELEFPIIQRNWNLQPYNSFEGLFEIIVDERLKKIGDFRKKLLRLFQEECTAMGGPDHEAKRHLGLAILTRADTALSDPASAEQAIALLVGRKGVCDAFVGNSLQARLELLTRDGEFSEYQKANLEVLGDVNVSLRALDNPEPQPGDTTLDQIQQTVAHNRASVAEKLQQIEGAFQEWKKTRASERDKQSELAERMQREEAERAREQDAERRKVEEEVRVRALAEQQKVEGEARAKLTEDVQGLKNRCDAVSAQIEKVNLRAKQLDESELSSEVLRGILKDISVRVDTIQPHNFEGTRKQLEDLNRRLDEQAEAVQTKVAALDLKAESLRGEIAQEAKAQNPRAKEVGLEEPDLSSLTELEKNEREESLLERDRTTLDGIKGKIAEKTTTLQGAIKRRLATLQAASEDITKVKATVQSLGQREDRLGIAAGQTAARKIEAAIEALKREVDLAQKEAPKEEKITEGSVRAFEERVKGLNARLEEQKKAVKDLEVTLSLDEAALQERQKTVEAGVGGLREQVTRFNASAEVCQKLALRVGGDPQGITAAEKKVQDLIRKIPKLLPEGSELTLGVVEGQEKALAEVETGIADQEKTLAEVRKRLEESLAAMLGNKKETSKKIDAQAGALQEIGTRVAGIVAGDTQRAGSVAGEAPSLGQDLAGIRQLIEQARGAISDEKTFTQAQLTSANESVTECERKRAALRLRVAASEQAGKAADLQAVRKEYTEFLGRKAILEQFKGMRERARKIGYTQLPANFEASAAKLFDEANKMSGTLSRESAPDAVELARQSLVGFQAHLVEEENKMKTVGKALDEFAATSRREIVKKAGALLDKANAAGGSQLLKGRLLKLKDSSGEENIPADQEALRGAEEAIKNLEERFLALKKANTELLERVKGWVSKHQEDDQAGTIGEAAQRGINRFLTNLDSKNKTDTLEKFESTSKKLAEECSEEALETALSAAHVRQEELDALDGARAKLVGKFDVLERQLTQDDLLSDADRREQSYTQLLDSIGQVREDLKGISKNELKAETVDQARHGLAELQRQVDEFLTLLLVNNSEKVRELCHWAKDQGLGEFLPVQSKIEFDLLDGDAKKACAVRMTKFARLMRAHWGGLLEIRKFLDKEFGTGRLGLERTAFALAKYTLGCEALLLLEEGKTAKETIKILIKGKAAVLDGATASIALHTPFQNTKIELQIRNCESVGRDLSAYRAYLLDQISKLEPIKDRRGISEQLDQLRQSLQRVESDLESVRALYDRVREVERTTSWKERFGSLDYTPPYDPERVDEPQRLMRKIKEGEAEIKRIHEETERIKSTYQRR